MYPSIFGFHTLSLFLSLSLSLSGDIYIYIYIYMCVCVCVCLNIKFTLFIYVFSHRPLVSLFCFLLSLFLYIFYLRNVFFLSQPVNSSLKLFLSSFFLDQFSYSLFLRCFLLVNSSLLLIFRFYRTFLLFFFSLPSFYYLLFLKISIPDIFFLFFFFGGKHRETVETEEGHFVSGAGGRSIHKMAPLYTLGSYLHLHLGRAILMDTWHHSTRLRIIILVRFKKRNYFYILCCGVDNVHLAAAAAGGGSIIIIIIISSSSSLNSIFAMNVTYAIERFRWLAQLVIIAFKRIFVFIIYCFQFPHGIFGSVSVIHTR